MNQEKIVSYSIINNEISFIQDLIEHHLPWLDGMYFLDNGSTDGTWEYLQSQAQKHPDKIFVEKYHQTFTPQYQLDWLEMPNPFPEVEVRNYAIQRTEDLLNPAWIIQIDGDSIWLSETREVINAFSQANAIGCASLNPIGDLNFQPLENRGGFNLRDPHVRIWRARKGVCYIHNPNMKGKQIHCIPATKHLPKHLFHHPTTVFTDKPIEFHLHWMYGKKMELFFNQQGVSQRSQMIDGQGLNQFSNLLPAIFWQRRQEWLNNKF